ncbi:alpha/beta hydrolase family protein [Ceratobasidium sp. AG-Ba]|nr:alpha/beta hydrolase family protein [Ceratobasidium sp. AG-Ba]QRV98909.1 alpha/beta hydrolase family protein [Ceratobasidium sp. AG-Ba]
MWVGPVSQDLIVGELRKFSEAAKTESVRVPAYGYGNWEGGASRYARDGEKIMIHFHGGSYIHGTAHPQDPTCSILKDLLKQKSSGLDRALSVDYRLCTTAPYAMKPITFASPFLDALSSYVHVTRELLFHPQNVIISGDSAGGHLALVLVRYLRDNPSLGLGMPGGLLLFSPWVDPMGTRYQFGSGRGPANAGIYDYLNMWIISDYSTGAYAKKALFDHIGLSNDEAAQNPYITPASLHLKPSALLDLFSNFPPTYIVSGDAEALIDEIRILVHRMSDNLPEGGVSYDEVPDAIHDFIVFSVWEPERSNALRKVAAWVHGL